MQYNNIGFIELRIPIVDYIGFLNNGRLFKFQNNKLIDINIEMTSSQYSNTLGNCRFIS